MSKSNYHKKHAECENDGGSSPSSQRHPRVETRIEIPYWKYVKLKQEGGLNIGFVKNLSRGGFFIETESLLAPGSEIEFEFYVSESSSPVSGVAKVVWNRTPEETTDPSTSEGMGLEFKSFNNDSLKILEQFIDIEIANQKKE